METTIVITNKNNKEFILKKLSKEKRLCNLKFYSFNDLKKRLFFDYDNRSLEFTISKYNVSLSVAKIYLNNLYFLQNINNEKVIFLNNLKKELEENNLLIKDNMFKKYILNKKVIVYGYDKLTKEQELILEELNVNVEFIKSNNNKCIPKVYEAKTQKDEVEFVINNISDLLYNDVDISKIKIIASNDYYNTLKYYSYLYNIPINLKSNNLFYSTYIAQDFLNNYDNVSLEDNIETLKDKYDNVNDLITIINKSVLVQDKNLRKEFIIEDLKNTKVKNNLYDKAVQVSNIDNYFEEDDYVFLLGFNINYYPVVYKDDDYLSDSVKVKLGLDSSIDKNKYEKNRIINYINNIKNLIITYKLNNGKSVFYPSLLINDLDLEVLPIIFDRTISYSKLNSKLKYAGDLDNLYKFNMISEELGLFRNNLNINYRQYNNEFTGINKNNLKNRFGNELTLAYTNMEMYNECAFKYFLSKILRIDIFEESFKTIIGNITHHILELGISKDIDINVEIIKFIKDKEYQLTNREYFYLEKLAKELENVLNVIKEQEKHNKLNKYLFEQELYVYNDRDDINVTFKGLIDKVMYENVNGKEVLAVVDYKTGSTFVTLDNLKYGLNIQLPIYLYLLKKSDRFKEAEIAGFYIQKVLNNVPNIDDKKNINDIRVENLRLQGFSNSSNTILELIDDNYMDSKIIKGLKFKKDGSLYSSAKVLSSKEMDDLTLVVETKINECVDNILNGTYDINPKVINGKNIACEYCKFKDICFKEKKNEFILGGEDIEMDGRTSGSD